MKKILILGQIFLAAGLLLAAPSRQAKTPPRIQQQQENRFLFIVDTASAMRSYSNAIVQNVRELLASNMKGEFRQDDTIGLWTYNDTLHPEFPMQVWSLDEKTTIMDEMSNFLRRRHYEKRAHFENVMPALNYVIKGSGRLTVILIFDGVAMIQGTPFDSEINDLQKAYARELRAAHEPFVIVFAARDGAIYDYTINYPGVIAIPHTAYPEKPAETNAPVEAVSVPETNPPPVVRIGPSIVMSGKKLVHPSEPVPAPVPETVAAPVVAPPTQPVQPMVAAPVPVPAPAPPPVVNTPAPAPVVAVAPPSQPVSATVAPPPAAPVAVTAPPPHEIAPVQTQPAPSPVVAPQNPQPATPTPAPPVQPAIVKASNPQPQPAPPVAQNAPVASISPPATTQVALIVVAILLLTVAAGLVVFLVRRSRRGPQQPSLISQSIDRPR
jgi:hypothetical protein